MSDAVLVPAGVDLRWVDLVTGSNESGESVLGSVDVFLTSYCGYWLMGVRFERKHGWLAWEHAAAERRPTPAETAEAVAKWRKGEALPEGWHRLDRALALRAWECGFNRRGADWFTRGDGSAYDVAIQRALFAGDVRYG